MSEAEKPYTYVASWYRDMIAANGGEEPNDGGIVVGPYQFPGHKPLQVYKVPYRAIYDLADTYNPPDDTPARFVIQVEFADVILTPMPGYAAFLVIGDYDGLTRFKEALIKVNPGYAEVFT